MTKFSEEIEGLGFDPEYAISEIPSYHGGACALRYSGRDGRQEWALFPNYKMARSAAAIACSSHLGGYTDVRVLALANAPVDMLRFETANDWFLESSANPPTSIIPYLVSMCEAVRQAIRDIARNPDTLARMHFYDLERALFEALKALGYRARHTPASKDGGYDLAVDIDDRTYLIEVKNWSTPSKVGPNVARHFADVIIREGATAGLLLSSSGFTSTISEAKFSMKTAKVILGSKPKIVHFCECFVLSEAGIWRREGSLADVFFSEAETISI